MNTLSFSRNISNWMENNHLYLITINEITYINALCKSACKFTLNYNNIQNIYLLNQRILIFAGEFMYVYIKYEDTYSTKHNMQSSNIYIPRVIHRINDEKLFQNGRIVNGKLGIKNHNILNIYEINDNLSVEKCNEINFPYNIVDFSERLIILETITENKTKKIVYDINSKQALISNYCEPNIVVEINNEVFLIDSSMGSIFLFNPHNLIVKKLTTLPGYVYKAVKYNNVIILLLRETNSDLQNTILLHILNKNNMKSFNGIIIFDTVSKSIKHSISINSDKMRDIICFDQYITMLSHSDDKLIDYISYE